MYRPNFQGLCHVFNNCLGPKKLPFWFPVFSFRILVSMASPYMTDRRASGEGGQRSHHRKHSAFDVFPWPF